MAYLNKVMLIGNVGKDPETRVTPSGRKKVSFSLATSRRYRDANGETREMTDWHNIVVFNEGLAGVAEKYLKKGARCMVEGEMRTRKWQDQSGQDRWSTEVVLPAFGGNLILLGESTGRSAPDEGGYGSSKPAATASTSPNYAEDLNDDIPF